MLYYFFFSFYFSQKNVGFLISSSGVLAYRGRKDLVIAVVDFDGENITPSPVSSFQYGVLEHRVGKRGIRLAFAS